MKTSRLILWLSLAFVSAGSTSAADIGFIEAFALATDRQEALKLLIPGTADYYYYHALDAQLREDRATVRKHLPLWIKRHGTTARVKEIQDRQALLDYGENPRATLDHLRRELRLSFNHSRRIEGQKPKHPTALNQAQISFSAYLARTRHIQDLSGVEDRGLERLAHDDLNAIRLRHLLSRLQRPDIPNLTALIVKDLQYKDSRGFGSHTIHKQLTVPQMDELLQLQPGLINTTAFINAYLRKLAPSDDIDTRFHPAERGLHLNRIHQFTGRLAAAHNSLKACAIYNLLRFQQSQGQYNRALFLVYLQLPRPVNYINPKFRAEQLKRPGNADVNLNADYREITGLPPIGPDERLVRDFFLRFFTRDADYEQYLPFVRDTYLKPLFAEARLVNGIGDSEQLYSMLSSSQVKALQDRIDLDFAPVNQVSYGAEEPVTLKVNVKNVKKLIVRVFEINTFNYYSRNLRPVDTAINLDGLSATREQTHTYDEPPLRRIERTFRFPELARRGVYIVELIGNGRSSRALISKGSLRVLADTGAAGHEFRVLDEDNQLCPQATLWLSGTEYRADRDGLIVVPYSNRPARQTMVLRHDGFSALATFQHQAETYSLDAGLYVDRESLVTGAQAKLVVRPVLRLNGTPISLKVLEDMRLVALSTGRDGVPTMLDVPVGDIPDGEAFIHKFTVPDKLSQLQFVFRARVRNLALNQKQELSDNAAFAVNQVDATLKLENVHLSVLGDGYVLDILGRNGEIKPDRAVAVQLKHRDFRHPHGVSLKSDPAGRVQLGVLTDIQWIKVTAGDGTVYRWDIARTRYGRIAQASILHAEVNDTIQVALAGPLDNETRRQTYSLLEMRNGTVVSNQVQAGTFRNGFLEIRDLAAGNYMVYLKDTGETLSLRVTEGQTRANHILSASRILERRELRPLQISDVMVGQQNAVIQLKNVTPFTRVHVIATRFARRFPAFDALDIGGVPAPGMQPVSHPRSLYVQERDIGEEYRYILDRKYATKFPGNMLTRPGLLLNPWAIRDTSTGRQDARQGGDFDSLSGDMKAVDGEQRYRQPGTPANGVYADFSNLNFLANNSVLLANLKPDKQGVVQVDLNRFQGQQQMLLVAVDPLNTVTLPVPLKATALNRREVRMVQTLDVDRTHSEQKLFTALKKGDQLKVQDVTTSRIKLYDSLSKTYRLMTTLSKDPTLAEFRFILDWPQLKPEDKREKYSRYACHELNFFLFRKDPEFFEKVIRPYIASKKDKTFMDDWLLGANLEKYLDPFAFSGLNAVEKILLARRGPAELVNMQRYIQDTTDLLPPNPEQFRRLFDAALMNSALENRPEQALFAASKVLATGEMEEQLKSRTRPGSGPAGFAGRGGGAPASVAKPQTQSAQEETKLSESQKKELDGLKQNLDKRRQNKAMEKDAVDEADYGQRFADGKGYFSDRSALRDKARQFFRKLPATREWAENNYYRIPIASQNADLIHVNAFWNDYVASPANQPFSSGNFIYATSSFTEMMLALAVIDLPFEEPTHTAETKGRVFELTAGGPLILFHQEILPSEPVRKGPQILLSQNYFRADSRYRHVGNERLDNFVDEEVLRQIAYGCQVVITNPTSSPQKFQLLVQVPEGAIPLQNGDYSGGRSLQLDPYSTTTFDYYFYFPESGEYTIYPVQVASPAGHVASAEAFPFHVVAELSRKDKTSWAWISQNGSRKDVLRYLSDHNLNRLDLTLIAFRMRHEAEGGGGRDFYQRVLSLLQDRFTYNHTLWSYAIYHQDAKRLRDYLERSPMADRVGRHIESSLLSVNAVERGWYQHLEYKPLVNARAHQLGMTRHILNDAFHTQYHGLLEVLKYHAVIPNEDLLGITGYLLLQDRVEEALRFHQRVNADQLAETLQYDYLSAYLAFYQGDLKKARTLAGRHSNHPVDKWRYLFASINSQLDEIEGQAGVPVDEQDRDQQQNQLASTQASYDFKVENRQVQINYQNLKNVTVNYYPMDVELLFSRKPFMKEDTDHFTYIVPSTVETIELTPDQTTQTFDIPEKFHSSNVMVEIVADGLRKSQAYYANTLAVQMIENYGQVRVTDQTTDKPLSGTYVKVYGRLASGQVRFYKDGYTDLRGRYDYVSLNTGELDNVQSFAILILNSRHGAVIREVSPPKQ